jgi:PKD repeat protein
MKKAYILLMTVCAALFSSNTMYSQNDVWSDTFTQGVPPSSNQIAAWDAWRASLNPGSYTYMTIKGSYDQTGITCNDKTIVNAFATAVKSYSTYISSTTGGHIWSICNRYLGEIWIDPPSSCSGNNCPGPNGYIIRPGIGTGNSNWGGVNTNTCNGFTQRMTFIFGRPSKPNDMGIDAIKALDLCAYTQDINLKFSNYGTNAVDSFRVYWTVNGNMQTPLYITCNLAKSKDTSFSLNPSFALTSNTNYDFKFWTHRPNAMTDSVPSNDTLTYTLSFLGNPNPPTTTDFKQCGNGRPMLSATPFVNTDSVMWYDKSSGGNLLGIGRNLLGPYITTTKTFYAQALKSGGKSIFGPGYSNNKSYLSGDLSSYNGCMLNVNVYNNIVLDSLIFELWQGTPGTGFSLYYKSGSYLGFEYTSSAWTLLNTGQVTYYTAGGKYFAKVSCKDMMLQGGNNYAFYYTTDPGPGAGNDCYADYNGVNVSNKDMTISGNAFIYGLFATNGVYNNYGGNCEFIYKKQCSNPSRTPLTVTVKPRPTGADVKPGSVFDGQFRVGNNTQPDVAEVGKTIIYELINPTGYTSGGHGNTWNITKIEARTKYGVLVPSTEYFPNTPSSNGPGTIEFTPKSFYLDSFITFSVTYMDMGPNFCDSTIKRTVVVAPTPEPDFKLPSPICLGDPIFFDNISDIHSGNMSYTWYFGDGDSSDLVSPVHIYQKPGTQVIRLIAKSFPWGTLKDTSVTIEVGELPEVKFKVNNKCEGLAVTFQNQTTVGTGVLSYEWNFGDNTPLNLTINPTHMYSVPGGYRVTLTATANGCVSKLTKNAYSFARPVPNFNVPLVPVCAKSEVMLQNTSTIALGQQGASWSFGDGALSTEFNGLHAYTTPGSYNVKLIAVSEFDCKDSITKQITIKATPNPDFIGDLFCEKKPTTFTNTTNEVVPNPIYQWTFSDNYTSAFKNVTRTWPYEGPFKARLKATYTNGCSDFIEKTFNVLIQPKSNFEVNDICAGETALFANLSQGDQANIIYNWDFGDGLSSNLPAPKKLYNPNTTTSYTVSLIASYNGGCKDTSRKTILVSESPICDFTWDELGFLNTKFSPSNTSYTSYTWYFGEGGSSTSTEPTYKYSYSGNFNVTMKAVNAAGCECEITKKVSATTDIKGISKNNNIKIYPNPNNGVFSISNESNEAMKVEIFNVLGVKVYSANAENGNLDVNLNNNARGIYLVKVTINGVTSTIKITVNS